MPDQEQQQQQDWLGLNFTPCWHLAEHLQPLSVTSQPTDLLFPQYLGSVGWSVGCLVDVFILDCLKEELRAIIFFYFTSLNRSVLPPISLNMSECVTEYWTGRSFAGQSETCKSSELKQQWTEQRKDWQTDCPTYLRSNYPAPSEQYLLHQIRKTTIAKLMQDICNDRLCKLYLVGR